MVLEACATVATLWVMHKVRQGRIRREFLERHLEDIREQNELVARSWQSSESDDRLLEIKRKFKPSSFLSPEIKIRETYHRDEQRRIERVDSTVD